MTEEKVDAIGQLQNNMLQRSWNCPEMIEIGSSQLQRTIHDNNEQVLHISFEKTFTCDLLYLSWRSLRARSVSCSLALYSWSCCSCFLRLVSESIFAPASNFSSSCKSWFSDSKACFAFSRDAFVWKISVQITHSQKKIAHCLHKPLD